MARKLGNRLKQKGVSLYNTLRSMELYGAAPDNVWPLRHNYIDKEPHAAVEECAREYRLNKFSHIGINEFKDYLLSGIPIIVGIKTGRKFWKLKGPYENHLYGSVNDTDNRHSLNHAITIVGYDDNLSDGSWIIANSAGLPWGNRGFGAISYACNVDIGESFVITEFAGITIDKKFPIIENLKDML